jgi:hypothetical protein
MRSGRSGTESSPARSDGRFGPRESAAKMPMSLAANSAIDPQYAVIS